MLLLKGYLFHVSVSFQLNYDFITLLIWACLIFQSDFAMNLLSLLLTFSYVVHWSSTVLPMFVMTTDTLRGVLCVTQDVGRISSSVQVESVSQTCGCVMETMTVETMPMNRTVEVHPPHHRVYYTAI